MYNFSYVLPSALILNIIVCFFFFKPRLMIRANKAFGAILYTEIVVILTDIIASYADNYYERFPIWLLYLLNGLYYVGFIMRTYLFYGFSVALSKIRRGKDNIKALLFATPAFLSMLIVLTSGLTGWIFYVDETGFHYGPLNDLTGICLGFYLAASLMVILTHRKIFDNAHAFHAALNYNIILLLGAVLREVLPKYLFMDTFCVMALIVIYLSFVNPELNLEPRMRVFNAEALKSYIEEISGYKRYKLLAFAIYDYYDIRVIYGGKQMDEGLRMVSDILRTTYREVTAFYIQGGRFVLVGDRHTDLEKICRELKERFRKPFLADNTELYFDAVFTIIEPGTEYRSTDVIFNTISEGLAGTHPASDGYLRIAEEDFRTAQKQLGYKQALEYAVDHKQVEVFLQPIFQKGETHPVGAEALARIRDSKGNIIAPGFFISIAEKNGIINKLGEQVFEKVCVFLQEHDIRKAGLQWINVNLSPLQFLKTDLAERYNEIAAAYGIDPELIHLEITEETMVNDSFFQNHIDIFEDRGFRFVLDDYGVGYSNMVRLKKCPFVNVKLDMSMVWEYCKKPDEILPTMIQAFKHMNFGITAEGIEDEKMEREMSEIGVDFLQGFYYSKPVPMEEFVRLYGLE